MFVFCCLLFSSLSSSRAAAVLKAVEISGGFLRVLILFLFLIRAAATALNLLDGGVLWILRERERERERERGLCVTSIWQSRSDVFLGRSLASGFSSKKGIR